MNVRIPKNLNYKIISSQDAGLIMRSILLRQNKLHRQKEYFWVIGLNTASDIVYIELVAIGNLNQIHLDPVEVFSFAVSRKCKRLILVHNHPSGHLQPSEADKNLTARLLKGAQYLNIEILDHIIITPTDGFSFNDEGLLDLLKKK